MPRQCTRFARCIARALLLALIALAACAPRDQLPPDTPRVPAGLIGHVLLTRKDALETLNFDTGRLDIVATAPLGARITSARWSSSGAQIAYAVAPQEARAATPSSLFVASPDGSGARAVVSADAPNVFYHWPTWDKAGTHLYALRADPSGARIERIDIASGERRPVVDRAAEFDVSRDERLIAFVRNADAGATLNIARRDAGGEPRTVVSARPFQTIAAPRFTSDGAAVLFSLSRPPESEASTQVKPKAAYRDGVRVALAHGLPQDIYSVPVEGGPLRLVVRLGADDPVAAWSPDGARVAVLTLSSLGIARPGGQLVPILAPGGYGSVDWAP